MKNAIKCCFVTCFLLTTLFFCGYAQQNAKSNISNNEFATYKGSQCPKSVSELIHKIRESSAEKISIHDTDGERLFRTAVVLLLNEVGNTEKLLINSKGTNAERYYAELMKKHIRIYHSMIDLRDNNSANLSDVSNVLQEFINIPTLSVK